MVRGDCSWRQQRSRWTGRLGNDLGLCIRVTMTRKRTQRNEFFGVCRGSNARLPDRAGRELRVLVEGLRRTEAVEETGRKERQKAEDSWSMLLDVA